jgi:hypothetical protein
LTLSLPSSKLTPLRDLCPKLLPLTDLVPAPETVEGAEREECHEKIGDAPEAQGEGHMSEEREMRQRRTHGCIFELFSQSF